VVTSVGLGAAMVPLRSHLSIATAALVLVVPVVAGVVTGGFVAGLVSVVAGFMVYDFLFIPPYNTLSVGAAQNWVALGVYAVVMLLVARVVANLDSARAAARRRAEDARHLFELSELLMADRPDVELGDAFVHLITEAFGLTGAALLQWAGGHLVVVSSDGTPLTDADLERLNPRARVPVPLVTTSSGETLETRVLTASTADVLGLVALRGVPTDRSVHELLLIAVNQFALALERSRLRERAVRAGILEEVDQLRRAMIGAVSHDLRTPLASMKVAASTLANPALDLDGDETRELGALIDFQTDRLTRLVGNLLDMTRIQAGVLEVHRSPWSVLDLVGDAVAALRPLLGDRALEIALAESLPMVDVDHLLIGQVLVNLADNAHRHGPPGTPVTIGAEVREDRVVVSVEDEGPGIPEAERETVFESFRRFDTGGRAGLGLAIAKTFVEAHGERIWAEEAPLGGARVSFTLPIAPPADRRPPAPEPAEPVAR
jgi:two-component system sensor histidine kinase KdpD